MQQYNYMINLNTMTLTANILVQRRKLMSIKIVREDIEEKNTS